MNTQEIKGHWGELRGKLKEKWGQLTQDDLQIVDGNIDQLISRIQQRVGADRRAIEDFLEKNLPDGVTVESLKHAAVEGVHQAAETVREGYQQVSDQVSQGYSQAEGLVRNHPGESMAAVLGAGIVAGVIVGLLISSD